MAVIVEFRPNFINLEPCYLVSPGKLWTLEVLCRRPHHLILLGFKFLCSQIRIRLDFLLAVINKRTLSRVRKLRGARRPDGFAHNLPVALVSRLVSLPCHRGKRLVTAPVNLRFKRDHTNIPLRFHFSFFLCLTGSDDITAYATHKNEYCGY